MHRCLCGSAAHHCCPSSDHPQQPGWRGDRERPPPVWDETIVLPDSAIGELAAYARRKGNTWFLAVMCGPQAKTIHVPLSFLGDGQYRSVQVHDSPADNTKWKSKTQFMSATIHSPFGCERVEASSVAFRSHHSLYATL
ncbi:MAG: hypothetical protein DMG56_22280 [Acidobacteria bacterium]|nr:MAG: hypothetical protein DMG56_22280 [Acidobacteriota bacterium]